MDNKCNPQEFAMLIGDLLIRSSKSALDDISSKLLLYLFSLLINKVFSQEVRFASEVEIFVFKKEVLSILDLSKEKYENAKLSILNSHLLCCESQGNKDRWILKY